MAISLGGCFEEKEEGIRVDGWNVKATQMEIMAGKFDASSSLTIILVAIYYFRVLSFWSLKNNKEGGHFLPSEKNL